MIIQSASAYTASFGLSRAAPSRHASAAAAATSADSVTISQAARARLAAASEPRSCASIHNWATDVAHEDPAQAEDLADYYAYSIDAPMYNISESIQGTGPIRYAATGEPASAEIDAWFRASAESVSEGRIALY